MAEILSQKEIDALLSSVSDEDMGGDIDTDDDEDIAVEGRA
ncbi:flagellar motor switch protein FliM, partial [candidate division KSB1 bacterium]|nr:flagellar motor switch protein FliM [candidate division KSB1 bacterium]